MKKSFRWFFLIVLLIAVVLGSLFLIFSYYTSNQKLESRLEQELAVEGEAYLQQINKGLLYIENDAKFLSSPDVLYNEIILNPLEKDDVGQRLLNFSRYNSSYRTISLLDRTGEEIISVDRVDTTSILVPSFALENLKDQVALERAQLLYGNRVGFSFAQTDDRIESSGPSLHVLSSVEDFLGNKIGYIFFNSQLEELFETIFDPQASPEQVEIFITQTTGEILASYLPKSNKVLLTTDKNPLSIGDVYPDEWDLFTQEEKGLFTTDNGLFYYQTSSLPGEESGEEWILSVIMPSEFVSLVRAPIKNNFILGVVLTSLIALVIAFSLAYLLSRNYENRKMISYYSEYDDLTEIMNHRLGYKHLKDLMTTSPLEKKIFSLCFLDINHLKKINDTYGIESGDYLLKNMAMIAKKCLRDTDIICRFGGDEFLFLFPDCRLSMGKIIMERIQQNVVEFNINNGKDFDLSYCSGLIEYNYLEDHNHADEFVKKARDKMEDERARLLKKKREDMMDV